MPFLARWNWHCCCIMLPLCCLFSFLLFSATQGLVPCVSHCLAHFAATECGHGHCFKQVLACTSDNLTAVARPPISQMHMSGLASSVWDWAPYKESGPVSDSTADIMEATLQNLECLFHLNAAARPASPLEMQPAGLTCCCPAGC